jgi:hypothetical protein
MKLKLEGTVTFLQAGEELALFSLSRNPVALAR